MKIRFTILGTLRAFDNYSQFLFREQSGQLNIFQIDFLKERYYVSYSLYDIRPIPPPPFPTQNIEDEVQNEPVFIRNIRKATKWSKFMSKHIIILNFQVMKFLFTTILILFFSTSFTQTKKVLFLGNSYTYVNDLPNLVAEMVSSTGDSIYYESNTPGGYTLKDHSTNTTTINKIKLGNWDFVVLQEQSQLPSFESFQVNALVYPYAIILDSLIEQYNTCGRTMFYMTWGRKNGDATNCAVWPPVCTYEGMDSLLRLRYTIMADTTNSEISPVGAVWRYIRQNHPSINIYSPDESHPSIYGSYAAACSFYAAILRKDPTAITFHSTISANDASTIQAAAKLIVYDSLRQWNITKDSVIADFNYNLISGFTFAFTNLSANYKGHLWDFDGTIDTTNNPTFTFPGPGTYTITLKSFQDCDTSYSQQIITITGTGIEDLNQNDELLVYPNPASNYLMLKSELLNGSVRIFNQHGQLVFENDKINSTQIDISSLSPGLYFLDVIKNESKYNQALIVE